MTETPLPGPANSPTERSRVFNNKTRLLIVGLVFALSLGYLVYAAFPGSARYYLTVSEFMADESNLNGQPVRVVGKLVPGTHQQVTGTLEHTFTLTEGGQTLNAAYSGLVPDLFENEFSDVVLEGIYGGGIFHSDSLIVKCPSKYERLVQEA